MKEGKIRAVKINRTKFLIVVRIDMKDQIIKILDPFIVVCRLNIERIINEKITLF